MRLFEINLSQENACVNQLYLRRTIGQISMDSFRKFDLMLSLLIKMHLMISKYQCDMLNINPTKVFWSYSD